MDRKLLNSELGRIGAQKYRELPESGIVLVLDNIRSAHNIGSAFRTSDAFKVDRIFLCGICAAPPSAEIHKSALGAEDAVPWEKVQDTLQLVEQLQTEGYTVVAVEQTEQAVSLERFRIGANSPKSGASMDGAQEAGWQCGNSKAAEAGIRYALIFGNEVDGVQQSVVDAADLSIIIPQYGTKHSLNVSVSIGVVLWELTRQALEIKAVEG